MNDSPLGARPASLQEVYQLINPHYDRLLQLDPKNELRRFFHYIENGQRAFAPSTIDAVNREFWGEFAKNGLEPTTEEDKIAAVYQYGIKIMQMISQIEAKNVKANSGKRAQAGALEKKDLSARPTLAASQNTRGKGMIDWLLEQFIKP
jgi:hypothetical protein